MITHILLIEPLPTGGRGGAEDLAFPFQSLDGSTRGALSSPPCVSASILSLMIRAAIVSTHPARSPLRLRSQTSFPCRLESSNAEMTRRLAVGKSSFQQSGVNRHRWGCRSSHARLPCPPSRRVSQIWGTRTARGPGPQHPCGWEPTEPGGPAKPLVWGKAVQEACQVRSEGSGSVKTRGLCWVAQGRASPLPGAAGTPVLSFRDEVLSPPGDSQCHPSRDEHTPPSTLLNPTSASLPSFPVVLLPPPSAVLQCSRHAPQPRYHKTCPPAMQLYKTPFPARCGVCTWCVRRQRTPRDLRCQSNEISESVLKFGLLPKRAVSLLSWHMPKS